VDLLLVLIDFSALLGGFSEIENGVHPSYFALQIYIYFARPFMRQNIYQAEARVQALEAPSAAYATSFRGVS